MTVIKNRSTEKGRRFWDHVEAIAGGADKVPDRVIDAPIPVGVCVDCGANPMQFQGGAWRCAGCYAVTCDYCGSNGVRMSDNYYHRTDEERESCGMAFNATLSMESLFRAARQEISRLKAEKQAAHTEGCSNPNCGHPKAAHVKDREGGVYCSMMWYEDSPAGQRTKCGCICEEFLTEPTAAKPEPSPSSGKQGEPS